MCIIHSHIHTEKLNMYVLFTFLSFLHRLLDFENSLVRAYINVYACTCTLRYVFVKVYVFVCAYINLYICVCLIVYMYMCTYIQEDIIGTKKIISICSMK